MCRIDVCNALVEILGPTDFTYKFQIGKGLPDLTFVAHPAPWLGRYKEDKGPSNLSSCPHPSHPAVKPLLASSINFPLKPRFS